MADDVTLQSSAPATPAANTSFAADLIGGVYHTRAKLEWGVDGTAADVSASAPLPVVQTGTPALPTGAATEATLSTLNGKVTAVNTGAVVVSSSALPSGAATEATLDTRTGSLTETAPATDTASSGLNGRLQRIAQRLTSLITALGSPFQAGGSIGNTSFGTTNLPTTVDTNSGNKSASTLRVVLATDQPQNTTALKVDGSAVTQPVSAASLPLPSGAATAAKQPALGTAGTASTDVISVQGIASMTALKVDGSAVTQPVSGTVGVAPIQTTFGTGVTVGITLAPAGAGIANGAGRVSDVIDNTSVKAGRALLFARIKSGASAPTAGTSYKFYLIRRSNMATDLADSALGTSDAAVATEPVNAELVGAIVVTAATATTYEFSRVIEGLSAKYSLVFWNATGNAIDNTSSNHVVQMIPLT